VPTQLYDGYADGGKRDRERKRQTDRKRNTDRLSGVRHDVREILWHKI